MKKAIFFLVMLGVLAWMGWKYWKNIPSEKVNATSNAVSSQGKTEQSRPTSSGQSSPTSPDKANTAEAGKQTQPPVEKSKAGTVEMLDNQEITDALGLYQQGNFLKALEMLEKDMKSATEQTKKARILAYIAKSYEKLGNQEQAGQSWNLLLQKHPDSIYCGDAHYFLSQQARQKGLQSSESKMLEESAKYAQYSVGGRNATWSLAENAQKQGNKVEAWKWFSHAMKSEFPSEVKHNLRKILDSYVQELLFSPQMPSLVSHKVSSGENLTKISKKYSCPIGFIRYLNKKEKDSLRAGEELRIVPGKLKIEVYKKSFLLVLYMSNGLYLQSYDVGLGKDDKTPVGNFEIKVKQEKPAWYIEKDGKMIKIPYGHPDNFLGPRWMGFQHRGFGIHGTVDPTSIGKNLSNGCVRLRNEDVEKLYNMVSEGTEVIILAGT